MRILRQLAVILSLATMVTLVLVGCAEEILAPKGLETQVKINVSLAAGSVDHGWLTIDDSVAMRQRMALIDNQLQSEAIQLLPGLHCFEAIAVDDEETVLCRGTCVDTIPAHRGTFIIGIVLDSVLPDLVIGNLTHSPASPTTDDMVTFTAVVGNEGSGSAAASTMVIKIGTETTGESFSVPALAPNGTFAVQRQQTLPVAQSYPVTATVDSQNRIAESNEQNNSAGDTVIVASVQRPDLVISSLTHSPANPTTEDRVTFTAVVRNDGPVSATASTLVIKIGNETVGQPYSVPALAPNEAYAVQRQQTLTVARNYPINAMADS